ncbi:septum formation family protein [Herbiconiux sp. A18JL235]|uniref:Septum formation family protein n=1 Tax=Herbiconiux sp. A18JL235 TaxID=3152363 RepID=A0AB39BJR8_9MICO
MTLHSLHRTLRTAALTSLTGVVLVALAGCITLPTPSSDDGPGSPATSDSAPAGSETTDVFLLSVGDCFDEGESQSVQDVQKVDCAAAHDYEVYEAFDIPGDDYPGDEAVDEAATNGCGASFATFIGIPYEQSAYDFNHLTPTADSWTKGGDHEVLCLVYDPSNKVSGSLEGAAS